jgi:hypothetical protein
MLGVLHGPLHVIVTSLSDKVSDNRSGLGRTLADFRGR